MLSTEYLPVELGVKIFRLLPINQVNSLFTVNKYFLDICELSKKYWFYRINSNNWKYFKAHVSNESTIVKYVKILMLGQMSFDLHKFINLKHLHITDKSITDNDIQKLTQLNSLYLSYNKHVTNNGIMPLTKLTSLSIAGCINVDKINMTNLTALCITGTNIKDNDICNLTKLQQLTINKHITNNGIRNLTNLRRLTLSSNKHIDVTGLICLSKLTFIGIHNNFDISNLQHLKKLTTLQLFDHQVISQISGIELLPQVQKIYVMSLCNWKLTDVDEIIINLNKLSFYCDIDKDLNMLTCRKL